MDCKLADKHLWTYLDGELSPQQVLELEGHLDACEGCAREREFAMATRASVRAELRPAVAGPALRAKVQAALEKQSPPGRLRGLGSEGRMSAGLLALAAAVLVGLLGRGDAGRGVLLGGEEVAREPAMSGMFREVVAGHTDQLPTEVETSEPERAAGWFRGKLGFRVPPVRFQEPALRLLGARVSNVGEQRAARLYYDIGGRRVTVHVFEATPEVRRMLRASDTLERAHVGRQEISYHTFSGYTVPVLERGGVVHAFTGDLDRASLLKLVASARMP